MAHLGEILRGGIEKVLEAGAELAGGHSIDDKEPKYGLAVTGVARPDEIVYNGGAEPGDKLVLTKRLGIGVLASALKNGDHQRGGHDAGHRGGRRAQRARRPRPWPASACTPAPT